jgi:hypothetical protein
MYAATASPFSLACPTSVMKSRHTGSASPEIMATSSNCLVVMNLSGSGSSLLGSGTVSSSSFKISVSKRSRLSLTVCRRVMAVSINPTRTATTATIVAMTVAQSAAISCDDGLELSTTRTGMVAEMGVGAVGIDAKGEGVTIAGVAVGEGIGATADKHRMPYAFALRSTTTAPGTRAVRLADCPLG